MSGSLAEDRTVMTSNDSTRVLESAGMLMIGDGVLGAIRPAQHCRIWRMGPRWWRDTIDWFVAHPGLTRAVAVAELNAGLALALTRHARRRTSEPVS
jgi:hypothetical protein